MLDEAKKSPRAHKTPLEPETIAGHRPKQWSVKIMSNSRTIHVLEHRPCTVQRDLVRFSHSLLCYLQEVVHAVIVQITRSSRDDRRNSTCSDKSG